MTDDTPFDPLGPGSTGPARHSDLATVRLTVSVTFNLNGELPGVARDTLIRMVDRAIVAKPLPGEGDVTVVEHELEHAEVVLRHTGGFSGTDFSQLLDL